MARATATDYEVTGQIEHIEAEVRYEFTGKDCTKQVFAAKAKREVAYTGTMTDDTREDIGRELKIAACLAAGIPYVLSKEGNVLVSEPLSAIPAGDRATYASAGGGGGFRGGSGGPRKESYSADDSKLIAEFACALIANDDSTDALSVKEIRMWPQNPIKANEKYGLIINPPAAWLDAKGVKYEAKEWTDKKTGEKTSNPPGVFVKGLEESNPDLAKKITEAFAAAT